jgi:hypothetical protein
MSGVMYYFKLKKLISYITQQTDSFDFSLFKNKFFYEKNHSLIKR